MKEKITLEPLDIHNVIERHNLEATLFNGNYLYIHKINGERDSWLKPLIATHHLEQYDKVSVYYNAYTKAIHVDAKKELPTGGRSGTMVKSHPNYFTPELKEVHEALTFVRATSQLFY
jgi:hypothetical protein